MHANNNTLKLNTHPKWYEKTWFSYLLLCLYILLTALPLLLSYLTRPGGVSNLNDLARVLGFTGFTILALQVALGSRIRLVDRPWGLDSAMRFHKWMGILAVLMLLVHPLFLLLSYRRMGWDRAFGVLRGVYGGILALALLLAVVFFAIFIRKIGLDYQHWRIKHKFSTMCVLVLGFAHGLRQGQTMSGPMRGYFWGLFIAAAGIYLYRNIYVIFWGRSRWKVTSVSPETHDTYTLALQPEGDKAPHYRPGQFVFLRLNRPGRQSEEHPFTLSSSPTHSPPLNVTIKESGDFTDTIAQTRPGDQALVDGPFGRFSFLLDSPESLILIAGGVGITPILSMLRYLRDTNDRRPCVLIFANKNEKDIIRREELQEMPENVTVTHVLSSPSDEWKGYTGFIDRNIIKACAGELLDKADVYLCGPPPMMDTVTGELRALDIPRRRIHTERFTL